MIQESLATIGREPANVSTVTTVVSLILEQEGKRRDQAKAERAAAVGAEVEVVHVLEVDHDHAPDPAPIDRGIVVEAEAVPAVREVAGDPALEHPGVLALPRVPKAGQRSLVGTQRRRPYAVPISRINVKPRSALTSTMAHVDSTKRVTAKRARTASSNILTNLEPLHGALQKDQSHPIRMGRRTKRVAKRRTDPTPLLLAEGAQTERIIKLKVIKINLLLGPPRVVVVEKAKRKTKRRMHRSLLRVLLWSNGRQPWPLNAKAI